MDTSSIVPTQLYWCKCKYCANQPAAAFFARSSPFFCVGSLLSLGRALVIDIRRCQSVTLPLSRESMTELWKVLVVQLNTSLRQRCQSMFLQLRRVHAISLGCEDLDGYIDVVNLLLSKKGGVRDTDGVDEVPALRTKLEACPAAVAVADGADFLVCGLELFGAGLNLWETDFLRISSNLPSVRCAGIGRLVVHSRRP